MKSKTGFTKFLPIRFFMPKVQQNKKWAAMTTGSSNSDNRLMRIRNLDGYNTPDVAVECLMIHETCPDVIWEPANGFGRITNVFRRYGHQVFTSDIFKWHSSTQNVRDFRLFKHLPKPFKGKDFGIITNPPFNKAQEFIETAMKMLPEGAKLCLLLRVQFLEGQKRYLLFKKYPPIRVHVFSFRLPRMHTFNYNGTEGGSTLAFAWFVWQKGYKGKPSINFIPRP